jgi:hypothetical protein
LGWWGSERGNAPAAGAVGVCAATQHKPADRPVDHVPQAGTEPLCGYLVAHIAEAHDRRGDAHDVRGGEVAVPLCCVDGLQQVRVRGVLRFRAQLRGVREQPLDVGDVEDPADHVCPLLEGPERLLRSSGSAVRHPRACERECRPDQLATVLARPRQQVRVPERLALLRALHPRIEPDPHRAARHLVGLEQVGHRVRSVPSRRASRPVIHP